MTNRPRPDDEEPGDEQRAASGASGAEPVPAEPGLAAPGRAEGRAEELDPFADLEDEDGEPVFELPHGFRDPETLALVTRAQGGDVEALNRLFSRYHGYMVEQARKRLGPRLRLKESADDLAQTTFREATRDFTRYQWQGEGSLMRWLVKILQNKIRDKAEFYAAGKRDVSKERNIEDSPANAGDAGPRYEPPAQDLSITTQVERTEAFGILRRALAQLSGEHRTAITLVFFEGLSLRDAGERMGGRSEDAVRMLLRRAEAKLREITRRQLDPHP